MLERIKYLVFLVVLFMNFGLNAQNNNPLMNVEFYAADSVEIPQNDTISIASDTVAYYYIEFTVADSIITDSTGFSGVHIEILDLAGGGIVYKDYKRLSELQSQNFITAWQVNIPINQLTGKGPFKLSLNSETILGELSRTVTKVLNK